MTGVITAWPVSLFEHPRPTRPPRSEAAAAIQGQFGYYTDVHTDPCYCLNRYYDPRTGHWLSRDPIGLEDGVNVYQYCGGNPVMFADPSGLQGRQRGVGPPTGLGGFEDCIPVWGPGRDAINEFQTGKPGWGLWHTALAVSDVFLVRAIAKTGVKLIGKIPLRSTAPTLVREGLVVTSSRAVAVGNAARLGREGEAAVRSAISIGPKVGITLANGRRRVPDGLTRIVLSEVKNVAYLSRTKQLVDYMTFATETGRRFDLYVREGTGLSGPLRNLHDAGKINIIPFLK
jgi:RHS repeat-associated protein